MRKTLRHTFLMTLAVILALAAPSWSQTFTTLYNFVGGFNMKYPNGDGAQPIASVIQDASGNLYGTTWRGGDFACQENEGCGIVFEINSAGAETILHRFKGSPDGAMSNTSLIRDGLGNLYGTTWTGGDQSPSPCQPSGCGVVFRLSADGGEKLLYTFTGGSDGCGPAQGLVRDKAGNLYGTTPSCGASNYGTLFKVSSTGEFTLLHTFAGSPSDGASPLFGHLTMDEDGNLYGVTVNGGSAACNNGCGVVYEFSAAGNFTVLHSFEFSADGCAPYGSLVRDNSGNLYGTTHGCDRGDYETKGSIWRLSQKGKLTVLYTFRNAGGPEAGLTKDPQGNLYGIGGPGAYDGGALFEVTANGTFGTLFSFDYSDGQIGSGTEVSVSSDGTLFGTARYGGGNKNCECGTVWSYAP
jgi:uncharacterized repeat protein (TIGR03803 family)